MLPRHYRLTRSRDFQRVRRRGRSSGSALVALYVLPNRSPELHIGFSASKRVGKATIRNRAKRLMREAVRHQLRSIVAGHDMVFVARPAAAQASYSQIADAICHVMLKSRTSRASDDN